MSFNLPTLAELQATRRATPKPRSSRLVKVDARKAKEAAAVKTRKAIRKRDHDTCRCCRKPAIWDAPDPAKRAHVHHLVFRSASKALQDAPTNLITLCGLCHAKVHSRELEVIGTDASQVVTFKKVKP